jgi:hypothetical protein
MLQALNADAYVHEHIHTHTYTYMYIVYLPGTKAVFANVIMVTAWPRETPK